MKLSVIIVNYNVKHYLALCLESVFRSQGVEDMEVWVVDNCSQDASVRYLRKRYPQVYFKQNDINRGFAYANNQAIRKAKGDYVLLLNPDTMVAENTFADCIRYLDEHEQVGAVGVSQRNADGSFAYESRRGFPSPFTSFCKMSGLCGMFPNNRVLGRYYMRYLDRTKPCEIDVISGAFMMVRHDLLVQCNGLDEDFFMYGEDIDLSFRLQKTGHKNVYLPLNILHFKGESTQKNSFAYVHVFYQAMLIFFRKHYSHYSWILSLPIKFAIFFRGFMAFMFQQTNLMQYRYKNLVNNEKDSPSFLFCVAPEHTKRAQTLCNRHELMAYFVKETSATLAEIAQEVDTSKKYDVVVFDTDAMSFREILDILSSAGDKGHTWVIGLYSASRDVLITPGFVYD